MQNVRGDSSANRDRYRKLLLCVGSHAIKETLSLGRIKAMGMRSARRWAYSRIRRCGSGAIMRSIQSQSSSKTCHRKSGVRAMKPPIECERCHEREATDRCRGCRLLLCPTCVHDHRHADGEKDYELEEIAPPGVISLVKGRSNESR
jgi:hypothetical protein